jgi:hypothetical protein
MGQAGPCRAIVVPVFDPPSCFLRTPRIAAIVLGLVFSARAVALDAVASLCEWDLDVGALPAMRERLRRRPEYPAAARRQAAIILRNAADDPLIDGLLKDAGRTVGTLGVAYLHVTDGVTLARLRTFMSAFGLVSPGHARALLSHMRHLGCIVPDPDPAGGRAAAYRLTPEFLAAYTRRQARLLEAVEVVEPAAGLVRRNLEAPGVLATLIGEQAKTFARSSGQAREFQAWYETFLHRLAGIQVLHFLVAEFDAFPPTGDVAFSVAATARRFKVSRTHIGRMMDDARRCGFIELEGGRLAFTAAGREALDWYCASRLCVLLACVARTLKAHPQLLGRA